jgi:hypothetical protein
MRISKGADSANHSTLSSQPLAISTGFCETDPVTQRRLDKVTAEGRIQPRCVSVQVC